MESKQYIDQVYVNKDIKQFGFLQDRALQDPILTNLAYGLAPENNYVHLDSIPLVMVNSESFKYPVFNNEFYKYYQDNIMKVGMGGAPQFIDFDQALVDGSVYEIALGTKIYKRERQEANAIIDLESRKVRLVQEGIRMYLERQIAIDLQSNANYTNFRTLDNSGAGFMKWNNAAGTPLQNIQTAIDTIRATRGVFPDTIIIGYSAAVALSTNTELRNWVYPNSSNPAILTPMQAVQALGTYFGITNVKLGMQQFVNAVGGAMSDVWSDNCIVAYMNRTRMADKYSPKFYSMFRRAGYPVVQREIIPLNDNTEAIMQRDLINHFFIDELCGYLIEDVL